MNNTAISTLLCAVTAMAVGCDPYAPDLGGEPFRCGAEEPRCPKGYTCDERSATEHICVRHGIDIPDRPDAMEAALDAEQFFCSDDSLIENNDSVTDPTIIPIPDLRDDYALTGLAICPSTDVDIYRFRIDRTGKSIQVDIEFQAARGSLLLDILNSAGVTIRSGTAVDGNPELVRAALENVISDTYFVRVKASPGVENNYSLHVITTAP